MKTNTLDEFTHAYLNAALWAETDSDGNPLDTMFDLDTIGDELASAAARDCAEFQSHNETGLAAAYEVPGYTPQSAGHDLWLTRNGHGAGFWDRGLGEIGEALSDSARRMGSFDLYIGDDGQLYGASQVVTSTEAPSP